MPSTRLFRLLSDLVFVPAEHASGVRERVAKVEGCPEVLNIRFGSRLTRVCVHQQRLLKIGQDALGKMVPPRMLTHPHPAPLVAGQPHQLTNEVAWVALVHPV